MNEMLNRKGSGEILYSISEAVISIVKDDDDDEGIRVNDFCIKTQSENSMLAKYFCI